MAGKKASTAARGPTAMHKYRGTGFEEFYADPPMTPAEAQDERENIYSPDLTFADRIQSCIQRYRSRRRLGASDQIFNKYLFLGGIDTTPRMFGGNTDADLKDMTPAEKRDATAIDMVYSSGGGARFYNDDDPDGWDVDFAGVVAGFCSESLPNTTAWDYAQMGQAVGLLENFLTYVLQHDVCPEYETNVKEALDICQKAKVDLPLAHQAFLHFPGQFNLALSEMFCKDFYFFGEGDEFQRPKEFSPEVVFKIAMAMTATREQYDAVIGGLKDSTVKVVSEEECSVEIVAIHRPTAESRKLARSIRLDMGHHFEPVGTMVTKPCLIEDGYDYGEDMILSDEERDTFFLDDSILQRLKPGFKLQLCVCELNIGIKFIKQARQVLVEWYTFLPQNLMRHYKEPVPNERPAPSAIKPEEEAGKSRPMFV
ncbi:argonaute siRNA chaperone complex subunit Arb1 [Colletotrichum orchidophilum]|uniref:Argonaute siRNA chaperone complex subunit Arb1 n=1 Tax=Colletotrichum orchidophilum TaxID=1209926 RepID=A0A1G4ATV6_9PEZI|nr:argonaute siRNA chaperone complex subunit Arb1 [Colletotrichum orchidophilum]OHE92597.1 argonaute siRNA chaperone complex subunit Arb1 [Colletotrichum orchidophilum]